MIKRYMRPYCVQIVESARAPRRLSRLPFFFIARHPQKWEGNEKERPSVDSPGFGESISFFHPFRNHRTVLINCLINSFYSVDNVKRCRNSRERSDEHLAQ